MYCANCNADTEAYRHFCTRCNQQYPADDRIPGLDRKYAYCSYCLEEVDITDDTCPSCSNQIKRWNERRKGGVYAVMSERNLEYFDNIHEAVKHTLAIRGFVRLLHILPHNNKRWIALLCSGNHHCADTTILYMSK